MFIMKYEIIESRISAEAFNFNIKSEEEAYTVPVLDRDPVFAANFLTILDSEKALSNLLQTYEGIKKDEEAHYPLLKLQIMWSRENFEWFSTFTQELVRLVADGKSYRVPYKLIEKVKKGNKLSFISPISFNKENNQILFPVFPISTEDPIAKWRWKYLEERYEPFDYREGLPAWYTLHESIVFEKYDSRANKHVRIIYKNGEFRYLVCGSSDKWQEIVDVPLEMDIVTAAFLFRN